MKDFYKELTTLYKRSRSVKNQINLMRKYPLRELPSLFRAYGDFLKRLNALEQDYIDSDRSSGRNTKELAQM